MGLTLDGIASGMPTTELIDATMAVERLPQQSLQTKVAAAKTLTTALQELNTKVASLTTTAEALSKPGALGIFTGTASSPAITVAANEKASAGSLDVTVNRLATKHSAVSAAMAEFGSDTLVISRSGADPVTVTGTSSSLDDMITAVNASGAGVTATKVPSNDGGYRIQFTATDSGEAAAFDVESAGTSLFTATGAAIVRQGADAQVTLYVGTGAEQIVNSSTNTFDDLMTGVSVTVHAVSDDPISLTVDKDAEAVSKTANDFIDNLNGIFGFINLKSAVSTTTDADGKTKATLGIFLSDSSIRTIKQDLINAATYPVDGRSPSEIGVEITKDGLVTFEPEKFKAAMAKDPAATEAMFAEISNRIAAVGKSASDKYDGQITSKITGQETQVRGLSDQIASWDTRLASREASLRAIYAAMEVAMSKLNSQMSSLMSSINSLSSGKNEN